MSQGDVTRIKVNKQSIGIIGLKRVMQEMGEEYADRPDAEVETELLKRISEKNYIPAPAEVDYGKALMREFTTCWKENSWRCWPKWICRLT
jgi:hypothetical protein